MLRTLGYILHLPSSLFFLFYGAKENFKVTYEGHFNQVVRRIQQHVDIWPQHGGSGAPSCQSHGSGEMSLSLIVLCFSGPHSKWIPFSLFEYVLSRRKKAPSRTFTAQFLTGSIWRHVASQLLLRLNIHQPLDWLAAMCPSTCNLFFFLFFFFNLPCCWTWSCLKSMLRCLTNRFKQVLWISIIWAADGSKMRIC